jgi:head-tail adaptor
MSKLDIGAHVHRVQIQQLTESIGGSGFPVETWSNLMVSWMSRREARAGERLAAQQISASVSTAWGMRYTPDMDPDLVDVPKKRRLIYQSRIYDIVSAEMMDRREGLKLMTLASSKRVA